MERDDLQSKGKIILTELLAMPDYHFKDFNNYLELWRTAKKHYDSSRSVPAEVHGSLEAAMCDKMIFGYSISDWYFVLKDAGCSTLRNFLREDKNREDETGKYPLIHGIKYDMYRLISMALQYEDYQYAQFIKKCCLSQIDTDKGE